MLYPDNIENLGGKAKGLYLLKNAGIPVPEFLVLSADEVLVVLENDDKFDELYLKIKNIFFYSKLAVRSSADKEDGENKSFAGFFSTVLNVKINKEDIYKALKKVYESASRTNSDIFRMNIVIQKMVNPLVAGVCFSEAYDEFERKLCVVSYVKGLADKLVDGRKRATRVCYKIRKNKIDVKDFVVKGDLSDNVYYLSKLIPYIQTIREKIYKKADIEWCIDNKGNPWIVQVRPITKKMFISDSVNSCTIASEGIVSGKVCYIDSSLPTDVLKKEIDKFVDKSVLVSEYTDTLFMPAINKAKAIVTSEGDILSHSAIISRELGIPCLVGVKDLSSKLKNGDTIVINTYKSVMEINGVNFFGNSVDVDWSSVYDFSNMIELKYKEDLFVFESIFGDNILYYSEGALEENIEYAKKYFSSKIKGKIQLSNSNKYHYYFNWKNFKKIDVFRKYMNKALVLAENFDYSSVHQFYEEVFDLCMDIKTKSKEKDKLICNEKIISLYFILDLLFPTGVSIKSAYLKALPILNKLPFSVLLKNEPIKNKTLQNIQKYLLCVADEKNKIFAKFLRNELLEYDYIQQRDKEINKIFKNKYPKYSKKMYELFYKKYM